MHLTFSDRCPKWYIGQSLRRVIDFVLLVGLNCASHEKTNRRCTRRFRDIFVIVLVIGSPALFRISICLHHLYPELVNRFVTMKNYFWHRARRQSRTTENSTVE